MSRNPNRAQRCVWAFALLAGCLAGCGNQANAPPATSAATPAQPPAAPASEQNAPAAAPAPAAAEGQNASVAELLSGSNGPAPDGSDAAPPSGPSAAAATTTRSAAQAAPTQPGDAAAPIDDIGYARVVSVAKIPGPRQICTDRTVVERRRQEDEHRVAGTVIGAIAGGLIGSKLGRGHGRTVATVGGAVAGGAIGREVQGAHQDRDTVTRVVKHCRPVKPSEEGQVLYDVVYSYQGQTFHARLDYDPGDRLALPVRSVD